MASFLSAGPAIVYLQDAHGQYESQIHTREILKYLRKKYGFDLVFIEGGTGQLDPRYLHFFKNPELNQKNADLLARKGIIGGTELFLLDQWLANPPRVSAKDKTGKLSESPLSPRDKSLPGVIGIENTELYRRNLDSFRAVISRQEFSFGLLDLLKREILTLSSQHFSKDLRDFFRHWLVYQDNPDSLLRHLDGLRLFAKRVLGLDLHDSKNQLMWPAFLRFFRMRRLEKMIDPKKSEDDKEKLLAWSKKQGLADSLIRGLGTLWSDESFPHPRLFLERFYEQAATRGFRFDDYPDFSKRAGMRILASELDMQILLEEVEILTATLISHLAESTAEKFLVRIFKDYLLLKKLLALELVHDEYERLMARKRYLRPSRVFKRLHRLQGHRARGRVKSSERQEPGRIFRRHTSPEFTMKKFDEIFRKALAFYEDAKGREETLFQNMMSKMKQLKKGKAVLVAGGFHSKGLLQRFEQNKISYAELIPRMSEVGDRRNYVDTLTREAAMTASASHLMKPHLQDGGLPGIEALGGRGMAGYYLQSLDESLKTVTAEAAPQLTEKVRKLHLREKMAEINQSPGALSNDIHYVGDRLNYSRSEIRSLRIGLQNDLSRLERHVETALRDNPKRERVLQRLEFLKKNVSFSGSSRGGLIKSAVKIRDEEFPNSDASLEPLRKQLQQFIDKLKDGKPGVGLRHEMRSLLQWDAIFSLLPETESRKFWKESLTGIRGDFIRPLAEKILLPRIQREFNPVLIDSKKRIVTSHGYSLAAFLDPKNKKHKKVLEILARKQDEIIRQFSPEKVVLVPSGYDAASGTWASGQSSFHITLEVLEHGTEGPVPRKMLRKTAEKLRPALSQGGIVRGSLIGPFWHKELAIVMLWKPETSEDLLLKTKRETERILGREPGLRPFHLTLAYPTQGEFSPAEFRAEYAKMNNINIVEIPLEISDAEVNGYADIAFIEATRVPEAKINLRQELRTGDLKDKIEWRIERLNDRENDTRDRAAAALGLGESLPVFLAASSLGDKERLAEEAVRALENAMREDPSNEMFVEDIQWSLQRIQWVRESREGDPIASPLENLIRPPGLNGAARSELRSLSSPFERKSRLERELDVAFNLLASDSVSSRFEGAEKFATWLTQRARLAEEMRKPSEELLVNLLDKYSGEIAKLLLTDWWNPYYKFFPMLFEQLATYPSFRSAIESDEVQSTIGQIIAGLNQDTGSHPYQQSAKLIPMLSRTGAFRHIVKSQIEKQYETFRRQDNPVPLRIAEAALKKLETSQVEKRVKTLEEDFKKIILAIMGGRQKELEALWHRYRNASDSRQKAEIESRVNAITDELDLARATEGREIETAKPQYGVDEFRINPKYSQYREDAVGRLLEGERIPQFIFAGAQEMGPERYHLFEFDFWETIKSAQDMDADKLVNLLKNDKITEPGRSAEAKEAAKKIRAYPVPEKPSHMGFGPRQIIAYRRLLSRLAQEHGQSPAEVLSRQILIFHINQDAAHSILENFRANQFYGFKPENILFVIQPAFPGYRFSPQGVLETAAESARLLYGHLYATSQLALPDQAFWFDGKNRHPLAEPVLKILKSKDRHGRFVIASHRINDLTKISSESIVDLDELALALFLMEKGHGIVMPVVRNPNQQWGSVSVRFKGETRPWLMGMRKNVPAGADAYDAFRLISTPRMYERLLQEPLRYKLRFKNGFFYLESFTGVLTQLPESRSVGVRRKDAQIHDFKGMRDLLAAVPFIEASDEEKDELPGIDELERLLERIENSETRQPAIRSLYKLLDKMNHLPADKKDQLVSALVSAIQSQGQDIQETAVLALGKIDPAHIEGAVPLLGELLKHPKPHIRQAAVLVLGKIGSSAANHKKIFALLPGLLDRQRETNEDVRQAAAYALGEIKADFPEAVLRLTNALQDTETVAEEAKRAIALIGGRQSVESLKKMLDHPDAGVRLLAIQALGKIGPDARSAVPRLIEFLKEDNPSIASLAAEALREIGRPTKEALPDLRRFLTDENPRVRAASAHAIGQLGEEGAQEAQLLIRQFVKEVDDQVLPKIREALDAVSPYAVETLANMMRESFKDSGIAVMGAVTDILSRFDPDHFRTRIDRSFQFNIFAILLKISQKEAWGLRDLARKTVIRLFGLEFLFEYLFTVTRNEPKYQFERSAVVDILLDSDIHQVFDSREKQRRFLEGWINAGNEVMNRLVHELVQSLNESSMTSLFDYIVDRRFFSAQSLEVDQGVRMVQLLGIMGIYTENPVLRDNITGFLVDRLLGKIAQRTSISSQKVAVLKDIEIRKVAGDALTWIRSAYDTQMIDWDSLGENQVEKAFGRLLGRWREDASPQDVLNDFSQLVSHVQSRFVGHLASLIETDESMRAKVSRHLEKLFLELSKNDPQDDMFGAVKSMITDKLDYFVVPYAIRVWNNPDLPDTLREGAGKALDLLRVPRFMIPMSKAPSISELDSIRLEEARVSKMSFVFSAQKDGKTYYIKFPLGSLKDREPEVTRALYYQIRAARPFLPEQFATYQISEEEIAQINHPSILETLDLSTKTQIANWIESDPALKQRFANRDVIPLVNGQNYIVLSKVEGEPIEEMLENMGRDASQAESAPHLMRRSLEYLARVSETVEKFHQWGMLHGDLGQSIYLDQDGRANGFKHVKMIDFSLTLILPRYDSLPDYEEGGGLKGYKHLHEFLPDIDFLTKFISGTRTETQAVRRRKIDILRLLEAASYFFIQLPADHPVREEFQTFINEKIAPWMNYQTALFQGQPATTQPFLTARELKQFFERLQTRVPSSRSEVRALKESVDRDRLNQHAIDKLGLESISPVVEVAGKAAEQLIDSTRDAGIARDLIKVLGLNAKTGAAFEELAGEARRLFDTLRHAKEGIAPVAYVHDPANPVLIRQLFESADLLVGSSQEPRDKASAHHVVFFVDRAHDQKGLLKNWLNFLKERYAQNPGEAKRILRHVHILTRDQLTVSPVPPGTRMAWVEWADALPPSGASRQVVETRILANRLPNHERIAGFEKKNGYGISLLQAALLLLHGPEESRLEKTAQGFYVQRNDAAFRALSGIFEQLLSARKIEISA